MPPLHTDAIMKVEHNDEQAKEKDNDSHSDLRAEVRKYPAEWNFSLQIPESQYRPPIEIPTEITGHGVNRFVYFVCSDLNEHWIELPPASPHQINVSRRIKTFLMGNLEESINSYPPFPGTERNYLRALIARISSGTHISPRNFYKIGSSKEDEEEGSDDSSDGDASLSKFAFMILKLLFLSRKSFSTMVEALNK
jgi:Radial spokehead-like protein